MTTRDMEPANWARTLPRLRRNIQELRALGCQVIEPRDFHLAPGKRLKPGGPVGGPQTVAITAPDFIASRFPKDHHPLL